MCGSPSRFFQVTEPPAVAGTPGEIIEIVNFTVTAVARTAKPDLPQIEGVAPATLRRLIGLALDRLPLGVRQPTLSQQLGILRDEGLVATRREGKYIFYGLASHEVIQVMKTLSGLYCGAVLKSWAQ